MKNALAIFALITSTCVFASEPKAPATSPANIYESLVLDLRKKAQNEDVYSLNSNTPDDIKALHAGKADAYRDAADLVLWYASLFPETVKAEQPVSPKSVHVSHDNRTKAQN